MLDIEDIEDIDFDDLWRFCQKANKKPSVFHYFDNNGAINSVDLHYDYGSKIDEYMKINFEKIRGRWLTVAGILVELGLIKGN